MPDTLEIIFTVEDTDYPVPYKEAKLLHEDLGQQLRYAKPDRKKEDTESLRPSRLRMPLGWYKNKPITGVPAGYLLRLYTADWFKEGMFGPHKLIREYIDFYRAVLKDEAKDDAKKRELQKEAKRKSAY